MPDIADRLKNVTVSASVAMTQKARDLAAQGIDVVGLSTGEPDFPTPPHVIDAAYAAACAGDTRYLPTDGTPALRPPSSASSCATMSYATISARS
jgi:aspartate aminotransferase